MKQAYKNSSTAIIRSDSYQFVCGIKMLSYVHAAAEIFTQIGVYKSDHKIVKFGSVPNSLWKCSSYNFTLSIHSASPTIDVPIIWVLGGPGSGKGTQCDKIVAKYGFTHLSSGDLLRAEVQSGSAKGNELSAIMERGELVSNELVLELLKDAILSKLSTSKGFLIDGYPREKEQGQLFEKLIAPVTFVLFFDATEETLVSRLLSRGATSGRVDDNEETIKLRIHTFNENNDKVIQQYTSKLKRIHAERDVDDIFKEVESYLDPLVK